MYPQQQQHHLSFTNLQQQFYSSNPLLLSFPQPSDSALYPPGITDPVGNSISYLSKFSNPNPSSSSSFSSAVAYATQTTESQNWIIKQAQPIRYDLAVGSSHETSAVSASLAAAWNGAWSQQFFANDTTVMLPNQTKVTYPKRCEVCKINCNSRDVYERHISGKKHTRNLQVKTNPINTILSGSSHANVQSQMSSVQGEVLTGAVGNELQSKKLKVLNGGAATDSVKVCTVCNIVCNSQDVFNKHLAGKKHAAQVGLMSNNAIGPYIAAFKRHGIAPWEKAPKKIKVAQSAWCEVCKINCNSRDVYSVHLSGKKHLKNLEKLSKPKLDADAGATTGNASICAANPIIGPQEKPGTDKLKPQKAPEMGIEAKKRKVVEGGASEAAVRLCTLCNVVCNSQTVFNAHLTGYKHAAMVKKQAESRGANTG